MFSNLAAQETYVAETNQFAARKQDMFLPQVKNIFASRKQISRLKHMFPSLATMKTMLTSFQCCWSKRTRMADGEVEAEETQSRS